MTWGLRTYDGAGVQLFNSEDRNLFLIHEENVPAGNTPTITLNNIAYKVFPVIHPDFNVAEDMYEVVFHRYSLSYPTTTSAQIVLSYPPTESGGVGGWVQGASKLLVFMDGKAI